MRSLGGALLAVYGATGLRTTPDDPRAYDPLGEGDADSEGDGEPVPDGATDGEPDGVALSVAVGGFVGRGTGVGSGMKRDGIPSSERRRIATRIAPTTMSHRRASRSCRSGSVPRYPGRFGAFVVIGPARLQGGDRWVRERSVE